MGLEVVVFVVALLRLVFTRARLGGFWGRYGTGPALVVALGLAIALDDWMSHALGVWTPLDHLWRVAIYPYMI